MLKWPLPGGQNGNMKYRIVPSADIRVEKIKGLLPATLLPVKITRTIRQLWPKSSGMLSI
jgi:hypothetical protein